LGKFGNHASQRLLQQIKISHAQKSSWMNSSSPQGTQIPVGYFYFYGWRELYESLKSQNDLTIKLCFPKSDL